MSKFWKVVTLIDVVRPESRTGLESWVRWQNDLHSQWVTYRAHSGRGKVIQVQG